MKEFKVGLLALVAGLSFIYMSMRITASKGGFGSFYIYKSYLEDASGILEDSTVRVAGIDAGYVKKVSLQEDKALVEFAIKKTLMVTENSSLTVKTVGFLGEKYLDLSLGNPLKNRLVEGSFLRVKENIGIEGVAKDASFVLADVKNITGKIRESLVSEDSTNLLKDMILDLKKTIATVKNLTADNEDKLQRIVSNIDNITSSLDHELNRNNPDSLLANLRPMASNLRKSSEDIKDIVGTINSGQGTIGKLIRDEAVVNKVDSALTNVNRLVGRINNIEADLGMFSGINTEGGSSTELAVDLYTNPNRFYRLGIVSNEFGPQVSKETTTITEVGGNSVVENKEEINRNGIKFNFQIAKLYQKWAFRIGLIQSTGGLGVDYLFNNMGFRLSLEAFDFGNDDGANIRTYADFRIWNIIYGRISGEDLATQKRSATISVGLKFTDEDLASLIGLVASGT